ncbi:ABC transporter permease [Marine Group I thaumarchaeote]|uniref:ABC transporter permease n=1 Tax=Marine Group I thaumarchaeote TaxID=2511932 RepID=A0A7K4N3K5_9ARCH|nr:ABC transporter permease [Marine Group I thaumarchaeote]
MMITDTYSIFWREMKRYKKSRGGFIIRLIQPAVWIIVMGNIFSGTQPLIESVGFDGSYIEFMTPGIIILTAIFTSIFGGVNTLWDRRYGFMNMALCSPISRSSIALGKMLAISLIAAIQATLILGIALAIGVTIPNLLMIGPIMAIVILFSIGFSGISVMFAAAAMSQETFWGTVNFLGLPMFMISPALFPLALMPDWLATIAQFNPVTYAVVLVRSMMSGFVESSSAALSIVILGGFAVAMTLLASYVFTREVNKPF